MSSRTNPVPIKWRIAFKIAWLLGYKMSTTVIPRQGEINIQLWKRSLTRNNHDQ